MYVDMAHPNIDMWRGMKPYDDELLEPLRLAASGVLTSGGGLLLLRSNATHAGVDGASQTS